MAIRLLTAQIAQKIDEELMSSAGGFSVDQLMELAGFSVAQAVSRVYQRNTHPNVLVVVGPGNNGGDGLVAARHLCHFGYKPKIFYPKQSSKDLYQRLTTQCKNLAIPVLTENLGQELKQTDLILDAIFGFSFKGDIRDPFGDVIKALIESKVPIASVDIPSGWDVEEGPVREPAIQPEMLISLTAPKLCAKHFRGKRHFVGGRFVTPDFEKRFELNLPAYEGTDQVVEIPVQGKL
ncbi:hypothetical protein BZG36_02400 [Bifiguratus adelaidae]|uniref:NAD(P)H-hydrate epimerase n=1 Tax=Bifiguratus adelaidae TaxID=1938954 RepID=A0A261Y179_9FUNG|nr:hypothetical protein BZG36_02400 [Bifiguratus adelaidae]